MMQLFLLVEGWMLLKVTLTFHVGIMTSKDCCMQTYHSNVASLLMGVLKLSSCHCLHHSLEWLNVNFMNHILVTVSAALGMHFVFAHLIASEDFFAFIHFDSFKSCVIYNLLLLAAIKQRVHKSVYFAALLSRNKWWQLLYSCILFPSLTIHSTLHIWWESSECRPAGPAELCSYRRRWTIEYHMDPKWS